MREHTISTSRDRRAAEFAAAPEAWGEPQGRLDGTAAADCGRAMLEAVGVNVEAPENHPRLAPKP